MGGFTIDRSKTIHVPFRGPATHTNVADRLRECDKAGGFTGKKIRAARKSRFREEGLDDEVIERVDVGSLGGEFAIAGTDLRTRSTWNGISTNIPTSPVSGEKRERTENHDEPRAAKVGKTGRPAIATSNTPPAPFSTMPRVALLAFLIAVVVPAFGYTGRQNSNRNFMKGNGADAGIIRDSEFVDNGSMIEGRADSPTSICTRWSHMSMFLLVCLDSWIQLIENIVAANVNGTLYIYGGEATTKSGQTTDTWSKSFNQSNLTWC